MESPLENVLIALLEDGRQDVLVSVRDLSDENAATKLSPDRWSVLECLEHLVSVEDRLLGWITTGEVIEAPQADRQKEIHLYGSIMDRSYKVQAPEAVVPTGRFTSMAPALEAFNAARDRSAQIARSRGEALYTVKVTHPRLGEMNGPELLHFLTGHARRHAAQIRETRAEIEK